MNSLKKVYNYFCGINGILFTAYFALVILLNTLIKETIIGIILNLVVLLIGCLWFCPFALKYSQSHSSLSDSLDKPKNNKLIDIIALVLPFFVLIYQYIIYYPGRFSYDSVMQYQQAVNNSYNDWHPVIQTIFAFKIPLLLTGAWTGSIVLFQLIEFFLIMIYAHRVLLKHTNSLVAAVAVIYATLNPLTLNAIMCPWKDCSFALGATLLTVFAIQIYFTDGKWIKSIPNAAMFTIVFVLTTLFRHNALLFTVPLFFAVQFFFTKKSRIVILLVAVLLIGGIKVPFYNALNVEQPNNRQVETLGLPMSVIGGVASESPELLDEETKEFVYRIAPKEIWDSYNIKEGYNEIKVAGLTDDSVIEEYGAVKVVKMMLKCFNNAPLISLRSLIYLTRPVYSIINDTVYETSAIDTSALTNGSETDGKGAKNTLYVFVLLFLSIFISYGTLHLLLLFLILSKYSLRKAEHLKKVLFILPVFAYNFGTMLLLSCASDSIRLLYYSFLVTPLLIVFLLKDSGKKILKD